MNKDVILEFLYLLTEEVEEGITKTYKRIARRYRKRAENLLGFTKDSLQALPETMTGATVRIPAGFEKAITRYQKSLAAELSKPKKTGKIQGELPNWKTIFVAGCVIGYLFFSSQMNSNDQVAGSSDERVMHTLTVMTPTLTPTQTPTPTPTTPPAPIINQHLEPVIDCTGPDGKHLRMTQKACTDFNNAWKPTPTPTPRQSRVKRVRIVCPDNARSTAGGTACVCEKNHYWNPYDNKCIRFRD